MYEPNKRFDRPSGFSENDEGTALIMSATKVSTTSTTTVSTTVSTTKSVIDLSNTDAKQVFAQYEALKKAKAELEKEADALKAYLVELTGWTADGSEAEALVDGEVIFKKQKGASVIWDAKMMETVYPEAFTTCRSMKPNFSLKAV
jgi:hypothetical protein